MDRAHGPRETEIDLARASGYSYEKTETPVARFDRNIADAKTALQRASDEDMMMTWSVVSRSH